MNETTTLQPYVDKDYQLPFQFPGWVISDTHFLHKNIPIYEPCRQELGRDHNDVMLDNWKEMVAEDDVVLHLGDLTLGRRSEFGSISEELPGQKFMLKTGNHDKRSRSWYAAHGFTLVPESWLDYKGWKVRFTHWPDDERRYTQYPKTLNVHGHVHSQTRADRKLINLSVEATDFRPVWITDVLDKRIAYLTPGG